MQVDYNCVGISSMDLIDKFVKLLHSKRYSFSTISSYKSALTKFFDAIPDASPETRTESQIQQFLHRQVVQQKISPSYRRLLIEVLKIFYNELLNKNYDFLRQYPDYRIRKLPIVLSKNEIRLLLDCIDNLKHKAIISTIYSAGLRLEEVLKLTPQDIDIQKLTILVRGTNGKRDRQLILSRRLRNLLIEYSSEYKPNSYLFEGQNGGKYSTSSVREIIKNGLHKAGINKNATPLTLRHSYAAHLLEVGTDIEVIRELLGHKSIRTTKIYAQLSAPSIKAVRSPLDEL